MPEAAAIGSQIWLPTLIMQQEANQPEATTAVSD